MGVGQDMTPREEKQLFADVQIIKLKHEQTDKTMQTLLLEFVQHSKETNTNLQQLSISSHELVLETRSANRRIDELEKNVEANNLRTEGDFRSLGKRVVALENFKLAYETTHTVTQSNNKWWSDNWFKFVGVLVILVPTLVAVYNLVSKQHG